MLTDDLFAVMDAAGVGRVHLVGESIGGTIALNAVLRAPERFTSLTVSNGAHVGATIQSVQNWRGLLASGNATDWSLHMMGQRFHPGAISQSAWDWYHQQQSACDPAVLIGGMEALVGADLRPRLGTLDLPVLLLHPDNSPFIPVPLMADFRDRVAGARLHVIGHARHGLPLSHAADCAALLARFLAEIDGA
jgi:pimeloyl-ACP methyl ester carboxylesterase